MKHERLFVVSVLGFLVNLVGIFAFQHGHGHAHGGGKFNFEKNNISTFFINIKSKLRY